MPNDDLGARLQERYDRYVVIKYLLGQGQYPDKLAPQTAASQTSPKLETVVGTLLDCYNQLQPGTWRTSAELMNEIRTNPHREIRRKMMSQVYYTANFAMYTVEEVDGKDEAILYFGGRTANPIFGNMEEAALQLSNKGTGYNDYIPSKAEIQAVVDSVRTGATGKFAMSDLELNDDQTGYLSDTASYSFHSSYFPNSLLPRKKLAELIFGEGADFQNNIDMFPNLEIREFRIYVLKPWFVKEYAKKGSAIARTCLLMPEDEMLHFYAISPTELNVGMRGIRA